MENWIWLSAAAILAYFVKGLCGFANTLVFSTLLSFSVDNVNISPVELVLGFPSNCILAWRGRKKMQPRLILPVAALVFAGTLPGMFLLKNADAGVIKILFGVVITCLGLDMLLRRKTDAAKPASKWVLPVIGLIAGVMCGLFGIGALLAGYVGRAAKDTQTMKANLCAVFVLENLFRMVTSGLSDILTADVLLQAAALLPAMAAGLGLGILSGKKLNEKVVRFAVHIMLVLSGIALILQNLL